MRYLIILMMAVFLTGCHRPYLDCRSEFLYPTYLASQQVNTPDPAKDCFYGQQIIVSWHLPRNCQLPLTVLLNLRFGTRELETVTIPIESRRGWWVYRLINQDYWCKGGILSYQAQLLSGHEVLDQWNHFLWTDIIHISND